MSKYIMTKTEVKYIIQALDASNTLQQVNKCPKCTYAYIQPEYHYDKGYSDAIELAISMLKNLDKNSTKLR